MEEQDLREIGISDPQHRRKLLQAARSLPKVTPMTLQPQPWPESGHLPDTSWTQNRAGLGSGECSSLRVVCPSSWEPQRGQHRVLFTSSPSPKAPDSQPSIRESEDLVQPQEGAAGTCHLEPR